MNVNPPREFHFLRRWSFGCGSRRRPWAERTSAPWRGGKGAWSPTLSNSRIQMPPGVPPTPPPPLPPDQWNRQWTSGFGRDGTPSKDGKACNSTRFRFRATPSTAMGQFKYKKGQPFQTMSHKILATKKKKIRFTQQLVVYPPVRNVWQPARPGQPF